MPCVIPGYTNREEVDFQKGKAARLRQWIETTDLEPLVRRAYIEWVDYCDYQNRRGEEELVLKTREHSMAAYEARQKAQTERVAKITVPKPLI